MFTLIFSYMRQHKWRYLLGVLALLIYDVSLVIPTKIVQRIVDEMTSGSLTLANLTHHLLILLGSNLVNYLTAFIWGMVIFWSASGFKFGLQEQAFKKLISMRKPYFEKFRSGDMLTRFSTDVEGMMDMVGYGSMVVFYGGGMIAFIIPTMFLISWEITLLAILPLLAFSVVVYFLGQRQEQAVEDNREAVVQLSDEVLETVEGIRVMRAYSSRAHLSQNFYAKTEKLAREGNRIMTYQSLYGPATNIALGLSAVLILVVGIQQVQAGALTLGQVLALQLYVISLLEPFSMLSDFVLVYQTGKMSYKKLAELLETSDDMEVDGQLELTEIRDLAFVDYHFTYPQAERESLSGISVRLQAGQTLGIVGKTGSGKTSLIRQLLRQYPLGQGELLINGRSIGDYSRKSVEALLGYVPQEHILFSKSVGENIALGGQDVTADQIQQVVETAAFSRDLAAMNQGLETQIGERGVSISGGQKQRISIARAFVRQPELLILDDSLSAVDAKTEQEIIANIQRERKGKTNIIVSHRLSAVHHADWVLVLDEGHILESGCPEDLLAQKGWYYEQYQRQQEGGESE